MKLISILKQCQQDHLTIFRICHFVYMLHKDSLTNDDMWATQT